MTKSELEKRILEIKENLDKILANHNALTAQFSTQLQYSNLCMKRDLKASEDEHILWTGRYEEAKKMLAEFFQKECENTVTIKDLDDLEGKTNAS